MRKILLPDVREKVIGEIVALRESGKSYSAIAALYGVCDQTIGNILRAAERDDLRVRHDAAPLKTYRCEMCGHERRLVSYVAKHRRFCSHECAAAYRAKKAAESADFVTAQSAPRPEGTHLNSVAIPITGGVAWVDPEDVPLVMPHRWKLMRRHAGWTAYAKRTNPVLTRSGRQAYTMHQLIVDPPPGVEVDHKNQNGLVNVRSNLRVASQSQQKVNIRRVNKHGFRGISSKDGNTFFAVIRFEGRCHRLGSFSSAENAARAYDAAAVRLHGDFAVLNFPDGE